MMRLWYSVILILLFSETIFSRKKCKSTVVPRPVHTFETGPHLCFTTSGSSTLEVSTTRYKEGKHSMKWDWKSGDFITYEFKPKPIKGKELKEGGIKLWLYNTHQLSGIGEELTIEFLETASSPSHSVVSLFKINLNFEGWRGIWVAYSDFKAGARWNTREINRMKITAPNTSPPTHLLFFDLIRFV
ncbi:uncharacterized protein LOC111332228 [Stylophora pistillata]|uniref:uncharacterized protein LOC111332228 n=1 Tax=Stylophora pistillata TaxID=50429 RepID=UPI000C03D3FD|nr:uncharacterized protein LOC111332228 [Stylophora pistillata]